jgi:hypothetical protein
VPLRRWLARRWRAGPTWSTTCPAAPWTRTCAARCAQHAQQHTSRMWRRAQMPSRGPRVGVGWAGWGCAGRTLRLCCPFHPQVTELGVPYVVMHMRGDPKTMARRELSSYGCVWREVRARAREGDAAGAARGWAGMPHGTRARRAAPEPARRTALRGGRASAGRLGRARCAPRARFCAHPACPVTLASPACPRSFRALG